MRLSTVSSITGYQAAFILQLAGPDLSRLALLPLIVGGLAIIGTGVAALWPTGAQWISIGVATVAMLLLIVLVVNIPVINSLGYREQWMANMALSLLGYRPAYGFWSSLGGMAVVAVGAILALLLAPPEPPRRRSTYTRR